MSVTFPEGFLWGTATSAPQFEGASSTGGKGENIWDYWFRKSPERFHDRIGPEEASDFYHNVDQDIEGIKRLGMNSYRTSISWSRLLPDGKEVNHEAVAFYRSVFERLKHNGIKAIVNLFHFDMPLRLYNKGGWEDRDTVKEFKHYARTAFELFGGLVDQWVTFNEPIVPVEMGYLNDKHLPGVYDLQRAVKVAYHTMLAHSYAVREFRNIGNGEIGIILNLSPTYPKSQDKEDVEAAHFADLLFNRSFLDPAVRGTYPEELVRWAKGLGIAPKVEPGELEIIQDNKIDFLGVNYYQPKRAQKPSKKDAPLLLTSYFEPYEWPERKINPHRGWEIYEKGIYDIAMLIKKHYGNIPWYVAENGIGVEDEKKFADASGEIQDDYRIAFMREHLSWLHKGISEGSNCYGYHVWTFVDNWSWLNAYKNRYGLYSLDLKTKARHMKKSGRWFNMLASTNKLPEEKTVQ